MAAEGTAGTAALLRRYVPRRVARRLLHETQYGGRGLYAGTVADTDAHSPGPGSPTAHPHPHSLSRQPSSFDRSRLSFSSSSRDSSFDEDSPEALAAADLLSASLPLLSPLQAVVLFVDISGFTRLSERYGTRGTEGCESFSGITNQYFGRLLKELLAFGADIDCFAGDAMVAIFEATPEHSLEELAVLATRCGLYLIESLSPFTVSEEDPPLSLHCAVAMGDLIAVDMGSELSKRLTTFVCGQPMVDLGQAHPQAQKGQLVVHDRVWEAVESAGVFERNPLGSSCSRVWHREGVAPPKPPPSLAACCPGVLSAEQEAVIRRYVPQFVAERLAAGQRGWLSEHRRLSVVFANVNLKESGLDDLSDASLMSLQRALSHAIDIAESAWGGFTRQITMDEKGLVMIFIFGGPGFKHSNFAVRAARAALDINSELGSLGVSTSIGVTTGTCFCGPVGNTDMRCEYSVVGDQVNLAARCAGQAEGTVFFTEQTEHACAGQEGGDSLGFELVANMKLKGKSTTVRVLRAAERHGSGYVMRNDSQAVPEALVGRQKEIALLSRLARGVWRQMGRGHNAVLVEGAAGMGKSTLTDAWLRTVEERFEASGEAFKVAHLKADSLETGNNFFIFRSALEKYVASVCTEDGSVRFCDHGYRAVREDVKDFASTKAFEQRQDLLAAVAKIRHLSGKKQFEQIRDLYIDLFKPKDDKRVILLVEDIHWLDGSSLEVLRALILKQYPRFFIVMTTRPLNDVFYTSPGSSFQQFYKEARSADFRDLVKHMELKPLGDDGLKDIAEAAIGEKISPKILKLIVKRASGNPLFCRELSLVLKETKMLEFEGGLMCSHEDVRLNSLPPSLHGLMTARIDRLPATHQLVLKVASVFGQTFEEDALKAVFPISDHAVALEAELEDLQRCQYLRLDPDSPVRQWVFSHALYRDTLYALLLHSQRRSLHKSVCAWIHDTFGDSGTMYSRLAHHWRMVVDEDPQPARTDLLKAIECTKKAGVHEAATRPSYEAHAYFESALALLKSVEPSRETELVRFGLLHEDYRCLHNLYSMVYAGKEKARLKEAALETGRLAIELAEGLGLKSDRRACALRIMLELQSAPSWTETHGFRDTLEQCVATNASIEPQVRIQMGAMLANLHASIGEWHKVLPAAEQAMRLWEEMGKGDLGQPVHIFEPEASTYWSVWLGRIIDNDFSEPLDLIAQTVAASSDGGAAQMLGSAVRNLFLVTGGFVGPLHRRLLADFKASMRRLTTGFGMYERWYTTARTVIKAMDAAEAGTPVSEKLQAALDHALVVAKQTEFAPYFAQLAPAALLQGDREALRAIVEAWRPNNLLLNTGQLYYYEACLELLSTAPPYHQTLFRLRDLFRQALNVPTDHLAVYQLRVRTRWAEVELGAADPAGARPQLREMARLLALIREPSDSELQLDPVRDARRLLAAHPPPGQAAAGPRSGEGRRESQL